MLKWFFRYQIIKRIFAAIRGRRSAAGGQATRGHQRGTGGGSSF
jgi:hypothetical protein